LVGEEGEGEGGVSAVGFKIETKLSLKAVAISRSSLNVLPSGFLIQLAITVFLLRLM